MFNHLLLLKGSRHMSKALWESWVPRGICTSAQYYATFISPYPMRPGMRSLR